MSMQQDQTGRKEIIPIAGTGGHSLTLISILLVGFMASRSLADHGVAAGDPWALGTLTTNSGSPGSPPVGYATTGFTVSGNPGVTNSINGFYGVAERSAGTTAQGLVIFFTGGGGETWWTKETPDAYQFAEDLQDEGYTIVQVKWNSTWHHSSPGNDAGTAHLGSRPATVIQHIYDTYYTPLGITDAQVDQNGGGFIITGNSGGSSQVSYAISHYGMDSILDAVIPTGGPPHSVLAKSMLEPSGEKEGYGYPEGTRSYIDKSFGYFNGDGPGKNQDPSFIDRWLEESVTTGGNDYDHSETRVHFIIGENDQGMQTVATDYYNRLLDESSGLVTWELATDTKHNIMEYQGGRTALWNAITAVPVPEPSSLMLLALTAGPLLLRRRRR